jgi:hypothetical protein
MTASDIWSGTLFLGFIINDTLTHNVPARITGCELNAPNLHLPRKSVAFTVGARARGQTLRKILEATLRAFPPVVHEFRDGGVKTTLGTLGRFNHAHNSTSSKPMRKPTGITMASGCFDFEIEDVTEEWISS